jgi:WD40 repeat protein
LRAFTTIVAVAALGAGVGCGKKALRGPSTDGGLSDLLVGPDGPFGSADTTVPDGGAPFDGPSAVDVPRPVDPEVSRAWTWQPCGTIAAAAADQAAVFDRAGNIAVLGARGARLHDGSGTLRAASSGPADFLVSAPDGAPLVGTIEPAGIVLRPIGSSTARFTFAPAPIATCGKRFAFSVDGETLFTTGAGTTCLWRTSTQAFAGSVATANLATASGIAVRGDGVIILEEGGETTDVVTRDFSGREQARVKLERTGPAFLAPSGDRLVMAGTLWDLDRMTAVPFTTAKTASFWAPAPFSPAGDLVLAGDGLFRTADGTRVATVDESSRLALARYGTLALSPDGRRAVSIDFGRATVMDVPSLGIAAVLGPPTLPDASQPARPINHLSLSRDGSLLVSNVLSFAAFGLKLAPRFADSKVVWGASVEISLEVDVSADGKTVAVAGDGRSLYRGADGRIVWPTPQPAPDITLPVCLPIRLRFSPKMTWLAGNNYTRVIDVFDVRNLSRGTAPVPLINLPAGCDAVAFSRDERLMATSGAALYLTAPNADAWHKLWSVAVPAPAMDDRITNGLANDVSFSPDERQLLVSRCEEPSGNCVASLLDVETGAILRPLPELPAPHPSFSPEGSWIVAGGTLLHLPSGDVRTLEPGVATTTALFTPDGDIIAGAADDALTRYCRSP